MWGCKIQLNFPAIKLLDYRDKWDELQQNDNPFAIVVMAHLQAQATTYEEEHKMQYVTAIERRGIEQGI
ncbi:MAG TPA: transposase, partial [Chloroflexi bacterium]|nr:transposase [Chloroflexota bacterium]